MTGFIAPDFDREEVFGLPGPLPEGERLVWQGSPDRQLVARHVFKRRWLMGYFVVLAGWLVATGFHFERDAVAFVTSLGAMAVAALFIFGLIELVSWGIAKTTRYSITTKRVVMRFGIALPKAFNLPFAEMEAADVMKRSDGSGSVFLRFKPEIRLAYLVFFPHVRGFRIRNPEPQFLALRDPDAAAVALGEQFRAFVAREQEASAPIRLEATLEGYDGGAIQAAE
ncbi:MAG: photosynthetic complex putative assembly protein PuhB [Pseudomonadota bacterium]